MEDPSGEDRMADSPVESSAILGDISPYILSCIQEREPPQFHRFFDLPRELRDSIYQHSFEVERTFKVISTNITPEDDGRPTDIPADVIQAIQHIENTSEEGSARSLGLRASLSYCPLIDMLLSNKTIKEECEKRAKQAMVLKLKDNEHYSFQPVTLPAPAKKIRLAELHLVLFCHDYPLSNGHQNDQDCQAVREVTRHRRWIEKLVTTEMVGLRSFTIHAHLCHTDRRGKYKVQEAAPCERYIYKSILELWNLPKLKKLTLSRYDFNAQPDLEGPKTTIFGWPTDSEKGVPRVKTPEKETEEGEALPAYSSAEKTVMFSA